MHAAVSSLYHPIYFSIMTGTPFVALPGNTVKIEGLLKLINYPLPLAALDTIARQLHEIEKNYGDFRRRLEQAARDLKARAAMNIRVCEEVSAYDRWVQARIAARRA